MKKNSILWIVLFLGIILRICSNFLPSNLVAISGEYIFSFDFKFHALRQWELIDWSNFNSFVQCNQCWSINHYSNFFSFSYMSINAIGEFLGFHPFLFYLFIIFSSQLVAIYIFLQTTFKKVNLITLFTGTILFAFGSYKVSLFSSGSWYGITHALLLIYYSLLISLIRNVQNKSRKELFFYGLGLGLVLATSFSYTANYLPYTVYSSLLLAIFFNKEIRTNFKKLFITGLIALVIASLLNFPIIISFIETGYQSSTTFSHPVNNEPFMEALTFRQWQYLGNNYQKFLFLIIMSFPFISFMRQSQINRKNKYGVLVTLFVVILLLLGNNLKPNLYLFLFENFPLMDTMRSSHRLYFFVLMIYLFLISHWLILDQIKIRQKLVWSFLLITLLLFSSKNVFLSRMTFKQLPNDYYQAHQFLKSSNQKSLYLPAYPPLHKTLINSYDWALDESEVMSIYANPFTTFLPFSNLISYEQFYYPQYDLEPIMNYSSDDFIQHLKTKKIEYIIWDEHFDWDLYPNFDIGLQKLNLVQQFDQIKIYSL